MFMHQLWHPTKLSFPQIHILKAKKRHELSLFCKMSKALTKIETFIELFLKLYACYGQFRLIIIMQLDGLCKVSEDKTINKSFRPTTASV